MANLALLASWVVNAGRAARRVFMGWKHHPNDCVELTRAHWQADRYLAATEAARTARIALESGDLLAARTAIDSGLIDDPNHATLRELAAWCQLLDGRAPQAVETLMRDTKPVARRRLLLNLARCHASQKQAAHLDLLAWSREDRCPTEARLLLAILEADAANPQSAHDILTSSLEHDADTLTCQMLVLLELEAGHCVSLPISEFHVPRSKFSEAANLLAHAFSHDPAVDRWLASLDLPAPAVLPDVPLDMVDQLSAQLLQHPGVIPTLVVAQRHADQPHRVELLRRALGRIVWDLQEPLPAVEALGELSFLAGHFDDARRWARHGLRHLPFSASLALLQDRIDRQSPEAADTTQTLQILRAASQANTGYADLRRALILRYDSEGLRHLAQRYARNWLDTHPDQPLARQTAAELAA